jgi:hypothetical protein
MTVRDLARQLGITDKEAVALCTVSGHPVKGPGSPVTPEQAARARDVLEGRAAMAAPRKAVSGRAIVIGVVAALALIVVVAVGSAVLGYLNKDVSIAIRAGQCFNDPGLLGKELHAVPCSEAHDYRAEAVLDLNPVFGAEFPGWPAIEDHARKRCAALGTGAQTSSPFGTTVEIYYFGPQDAVSWQDPDNRKIVCAEKVA